MIDGVDVSDPEAGTQWVFANYNWFQEVQVAGLGAPAEYGGFTGVASNSLIRSGSNRFSGLFETLYQNKDMIGENITEEVLAREPGSDVGQDRLHHRHDGTSRRAHQARQDVVLHVVSSTTGRRTRHPAIRRPAATMAKGPPVARRRRHVSSSSRRYGSARPIN